VAQQLTKIIADEVLLESAIAAARDSGTPYATNPCQFCTIVGTWHTQLRMVSPSPPRAREHRRYEIGQQPFWTPLRFPGQYYDAESDLFENWNIDTKPNIGRYLQLEPLLSTMSTPTNGARGTLGAGLRLLGENDPLSKQDPDGRSLVSTEGT